MKPDQQLNPTIIVIFGGTGDLAWRKLIPSLFDLYRDGRMPARFEIIAVGRKPLHDDNLRDHLLDGVKKFGREGELPMAQWNRFARRIIYQHGEYKDPETYVKLQQHCAKFDKQWKVHASRIFHLALPPTMVPVGLLGLAIKTTRVRGVIAASMASRSCVKFFMGTLITRARNMSPISR